MPSLPEIDGQVLTYEKSPPQGRARKIIHVNGVMSPMAKQKRDLEALVWLTMEAPLDAIAVHCAGLPKLDSRSADEILGYDEHGLPG